MDHTQSDSIIKGSRGVWLLAWPSILTNLLYATGSIVAIKVVGNFGPNEVAAAITGQRITFVIQAILSGILAGTTALVARNWGAKKFDEANLFVTNTFQLVAFISLVSSIVIYQFADEISLCGPLDRIRDKINDWKQSPVTSLLINGNVSLLRQMAELTL